MQKYILVNAQNVSINGRSQLVNGLCYLRQRAGPPDVPSVTVAGCFGKDKKRGKVKQSSLINRSSIFSCNKVYITLLYPKT